jgi:hypothetical protein
MIVNPQKGPAPITLIFDETDTIRTKQIMPYLGPSYDWHGSVLTPQFFGYKSLTFHTSDGVEHTYTGKLPTAKQIEKEVFNVLDETKNE